LGILGPTIRAEVGDTIIVHFMNKLTTVDHNLTMHTHGVIYDKISEGAGRGQGIPPGQNITYTWRVPSRSGPGPNDPSSIMWAYHSHIDNPEEFAAGLVGGIIITRKGSAKSPADPRPSDVDRELFVMFAIYDENLSLYLDANVQANTPAAQVDDPDFIESNLKHAINGYIFNNVPGLDMYPGERVRWYVVGFGDEADVHTPHWHGHTVLDYGRRVDTLSLIPAQFKTVDMVPDSIGTWSFHCHVNGHHTDGMFTDYQVLCRTNCPTRPPPPPPVNAASSLIVSLVLVAVLVILF
jgi:FtsP/CotA-like multicopper oxidase with cupredoxin domain